MAEAYLNALGGGRYAAQSAGLEPGTLNPVVVAVMKEDGLDISRNKTKGVFDFYKRGERFSYVFTVCDEAAGQQCPIFPGTTRNIHWGFPDPSTFTGTPEARLQKTREVRDTIKAKIQEFIEQTGKETR